MVTINRQLVTTADKILQLTKERLTVLKDKKESNKAYADELKRIDKEIEELINGKSKVEKNADVDD